jgi:hypothetical protein
MIALIASTESSWRGRLVRWHQRWMRPPMPFVLQVVWWIWFASMTVIAYRHW